MTKQLESLNAALDATYAALERNEAAVQPDLDLLLQEADYDTGLINDYGGGNVDWWQDYIRAEIERCNAYWRTIIESYLEEPEPTPHRRTCPECRERGTEKLLCCPGIRVRCPDCMGQKEQDQCRGCGAWVPAGDTTNGLCDTCRNETMETENNQKQGD